MNISDYLRTALLNHALGVAACPSPTTVWAALYTVAPSSSGGGIEVTASEYQRIPAAWATAVLGSTSNSADIRFPASGSTSSNWGTVVALGLFDSPTHGNLLFFGPLSAGVVLALGTDFRVAATDLAIAIS